MSERGGCEFSEAESVGAVIALLPPNAEESLRVISLAAD
jgi:hypothetical protein